MENLYSRFLGVGFQNKIPNNEHKTLSKSSSMPFYLSFQARKLPTILSGEIPFKKRNEGITSSDIKVQMLEEKLKNLEIENNKMLQTINQNKNNEKNKTIPRRNIQPYIMPMPLLILNNNNDMNNYNNMSRTHLLNNELQKTRLKFDKYRGLQKQDYNPDIMQNPSNDINKAYNSIFNRQQNYNPLKQKTNEYEQEIGNIHLKKKARKFINKLDKEIYSPIEDDFQNYINNVNKNIQQQLKEDNIILNNDIDKLENDFIEMKHFLKEKLKNMEKKQKGNFDKLIKVLRKVGGNKISKSIQNIFEGKNYDLQKAEEEYLANDVFNLPNIIEKKLIETELSNIEKEKIMKKRMEKKMEEEYERKRDIEELKQKERLKMLETQRERERIENIKNLNLLRYEMRKEKEDRYNNYINNMNQFFMRNQNLPLNDKYRLFYMEQMKNSNGNNGNIPFNIFNCSLDEILKYMLLKKMGLDKVMNSMNNIYQNNYDDYNMIMNNNSSNKNMNGINNNEEEKKSIIKNDNDKKERFPSIIRKKEEGSKNTKKTKSKNSSKKIINSNSKISSIKNVNNKKSESKNDNKDKNNENKENDNNKKKDKENDSDNEDESEDDDDEEEEENDDDDDEENNEEEDENNEENNEEEEEDDDES